MSRRRDGDPDIERGSLRISVLIATRARPDGLARCLESVARQSRPADRVVVVENAIRDAATAQVVERAAAAGLPCELVYEPVPGLGRAHNRGLAELREDVVAVTDDDVVTGPSWLEAIATGFARDERIGVVTGRIQPMELETEAQRLIERYARFDKGASAWSASLAQPLADRLFPFAAGTFGSGANMSFRREALVAIGGFDDALGAGTLARGGDDLAAFLDVIQAGWTIRYEPAAVIAHEHPRSMDALERQMFGYGAGLTAYLTRAVLRNPGCAPAMLSRMPGAVRHALSSDSAKNSGKGVDFPARLTRRERVGMLAGPWLYLRSRHRARRSGNQAPALAISDQPS